MSAALDLAVHAFRKSERARLAYDRAHRDMLIAVTRLEGSEEFAEYVQITDDFLDEMSTKREKEGLPA